MGNSKEKRLKQSEMITAFALKTWARYLGGCTQANMGLATPF